MREGSQKTAVVCISLEIKHHQTYPQPNRVGFVPKQKSHKHPPSGQEAGTANVCMLPRALKKIIRLSTGKAVGSHLHLDKAQEGYMTGHGCERVG